MIDRFTYWPEAIYRYKTVLQTTVTKTFSIHWIAKFGVSRLIITDQDSQFKAQLFDVLTKLVGSKRCQMTAYHSETNRIIE